MSPLLFVICMEYLTRCLKIVEESPNFLYHLRCGGVKKNHLCFANDVIMCCKGDYVSVHTMLQDFQHFSKATGLEVNKLEN